MKQLRLCSGSESRAKILTDAGIPFLQSPVDYDEEQIIAHSPQNFAYQATLGKFQQALKLYDYKEIPILCADSVVTSHNKLLRKAKDIEEAREILLTQSGSVTSIISCMMYKDSGLSLIDLSSTDYIFDKFDQKALEEYLESGLWMGKAGACMVEGFCKKYIKEVRGYESCAMGLSVEKLKIWL